MVYVLSKDGKPLMPCENVVARLLLKDKKAKVKCKEPFTIKLLVDSTEYTQPLTLGIDTGTRHIGSAVVNEKGDVLYMAQTMTRTGIKKRMTRRAKSRKLRRSRKTRYRKCRFLNRKNSIRKDRFAPTVKSIIDSNDREIKEIYKILPITTLVIETGKFDPHLMKNPALANEKIKRWGYQKGTKYGYANNRAFVLARDKYTCQRCKKKGGKMEAHHVLPKSKGGQDIPENMITLCPDCHYGIHHKGYELNVKVKKRVNLADATQMNSLRVQILRRYPEAIETFGYVTKENSWSLGIPKDHYLDACVIASGGNLINFKQNIVYYKRCVPEGCYQVSNGVPNKIMGFLTFDKVKYKGKFYFIGTRYSTGYATLCDINGEKQIFTNPKTPKMCNMKRITPAKSVIIDTKQLVL